MNWSDAELIKEYRSGNLDAFQIFYERYRNSLYTFLYNRCRGEACDFFQETFVRFINAARSKKIDNPKSYLFQIAMNLIRNSGRKAKVLSLSDEYDIPDEPEDQEENIPAEALQDSLAELARNKPLFYDVLHLHVYAKMTFEEIGKLKEKSKDTIASRYRYAIHYLRKIIQDKKPDEAEVSYV